MRILTSTLLLTTILAFSGCKKDNESSTSTLTSKTWKRGITDKNPSTNPQGNILYSPVNDCEKDDIFKFGADGTVSIDRGTNKCESTEAKNVAQNYSLNRTTKEFVINGTKFTLAEESSGQIKYYTAIPSTTGFQYLIYLLQ